MRGRWWMAMAGLAAALSGAPARGETPSELLEKGVFQQETAGNLDGAVDIYKQIVDEANANRRFVAEAQYRIGLCCQKQGKKTEAQAAFQQLIALYPDQTELIAKARQELGEPEADRPPAIVSTNPVAFADDISADLDKMTVTFDRKMTNNSWSWTGGGDTFPKGDRPFYDAALTTCTRPCKLEPGKVYWVGVNSPSHRNFKSAEGLPAPWYVILFATKSADGKPTEIPAEMLNRAKAINARAMGLSEADKKAAEDLASEGWRLWGARKLAEAEAKFKEAVEKDPTNANAWNGLGWAQRNQGKTLNAKESFERCVALDPKAAAAMNGLGWIAKGAGNTDEALDWWKKAVATAPATTAALSGLASTCMETSRYDQAAQYYQTWLKAEPNNADAKASLEKANAAARNVKAATSAAEQWLKTLDAGNYGNCWEQSAALMRNAMAKTAFETAARDALAPFGKVVSRKIVSATFAMSVPSAPDGEYVIMQTQTDFANKKEAVETVTATKDKDGAWRVLGYYIK